MKNFIRIYIQTLLPLAMLIFCGIKADAQNVGISNTSITPEASSILELRSTTGGFLMPRMNMIERNAIVNPAVGLIVYQTNNTPGYYYYDGASWSPLADQGSDDLGDHQYDENMDMNGNWLSGDGDDEGLFISSTGNVGVGTNSPDASLHVMSAASSDPFIMKIHRNSGVAGQLSGLGIGVQGGSGVVKSGIVHEREAGNGVGKLHFLVDNSSDANDVGLAQSRMTIDRNGNVGIGTSTPQVLLDINGAARIGGLAGSGTRMVVVDDQGDLSSQSIPSGGGLAPGGATLALTLTSDVTSLDVTGVSILSVNSNSDDHKIKGLSGGVAGQIIYVFNTDNSDDFKFKKNSGSQRFRVDTEIKKKQGAIIMFNGTHWYIMSNGDD